MKMNAVLEEVERGPLTNKFFGVAHDLDGLRPAERFDWVLRNSKRPGLSTGFGNLSVVSLAEMAKAAERAGQKVDVIFVDTHTIHHETHLYAGKLKRIYGHALEFHTYSAPTSASQLIEKHGQFWESPEKLLEVGKITKEEPLRRAFTELGIDVWISGLIRDPLKIDRVDTPVFGISQKFGLPKICPLADRSKAAAQRYIKEHKLLQNPTGCSDWYELLIPNKVCGVNLEDDSPSGQESEFQQQIDYI